MNEHVTNTVALVGACAPWWASVSLASTLQVVSIIWITLQVINFFVSKRWGKHTHGDDHQSD